MESSKGVVIIGAGLSGLALALALSTHSIPSTIYESRAESYDQGGAIMLSPNALQILDNLGVYRHIRPRGFSFETLVFRNAAGELTDKYYFGHEEKYGYKALRVYRYILIEALTSLLGDRGVPIHYNRKFSSITSESSESGSTITFSDGSSTTAALVIGADGIHSKVRGYLDPTSIPTYSGLVAITTAVEKSSLRLPAREEYPMPVSISAKNGAFVMAPQDFHGDELLAGTQFAVPERGRVGWDSFIADKEGLLELMRSKKEEWPQIVQFALERMTKEKMSAWPFYVVPRIEKWFSDKGRVVLAGDAAHAIPPTTGQGVNQAFEDVYTLSLLLSKYTDLNLNEASWTTGLQNWQKRRQERIDRILDLTRRMNSKRLPAAEQEKLADGEVWHGEEGEAAIGEMGWLYGADLKEMVRNWTGKGF